MRIGVISGAHKPDRTGSVTDETLRLLAARGAVVTLMDPEERLIDLAQVRVEQDLYLLKSAAESALALAAALDVAGARILNPYPATVNIRDKVVATRLLQAAGAPLPATYMAAHPQQLAASLAEGPLVVKPYRGGSQGRGVQVVRSAAELEGLAGHPGLLFAQRYHQPDGRDHKIYVIGGQVFGLMRVWPAKTYEEKLGEPFRVPAEMCEIARRCGRAFGVDLFGLDSVVSDGRPYVVDVNAFPGFKGVPDAARLLADYILAACEKALPGGPPPGAAAGGAQA